MKINLSVWLAVPLLILFAAGCSDRASAEKRISVDLKHFAEKASRLFA